MKLKTRLIFLNLGMVMLLFAGMLSYMTINTYSTVKSETIEKIEYRTKNVANQMEVILNDALDDTKAIANTLAQLKMSGGNKREVVDQYLKQMLKSNNNYMYTWAAFEPNAFDGKDATVSGQLSSNINGRYLPSWGKMGDKVILEYCKDVENKKYYSIPKQTHKSYITKPSTYVLDGQEVTTITFCEPILINGEFVGVTGIDISIDQLQKINSEVKIYENGFGRLINNEGLVLAHKNIKKVNKVAMEMSSDEGSVYINNIKNGKAFEFESKSETLDCDVYRFFTPINFKGSDLNWSYTTIVPVKEMMTTVNSMFKAMIVIGVIAMLLIGGMLYYNSNYILKSIDVILKVVNRLAKYDLRFDTNDKSAIKMLERKDETGDMLNGLASMQKNFINLIKKVQDITSQVSASSEELTATAQQSASSSEEVSRTVQEIAEGAMEQADSTENGSNKINDLGDLIRDNQGYMKDVNDTSNNVSSLVNEGLRLIEELISKTNESGQAAGEINQVIKQTSESSDKISSASEMIASIAERTNLLALNAAIEAARAGDAGKGFAVVADEIRKLAEQSTLSTKEIDKIVEELASNSSNAVDKMQEVSVIVKEQVVCANDTESKFNDISQAINISEKAVGRMNNAVTTMEERKSNILDVIQSLSAIAEENAASAQEASASTEEQLASVQEIANASENLSELAQDLQQSISVFLV